MASANLANEPLKLNTGATIPALGLGTWQSPPGAVKQAVLTALRAGYRHIDCAYMYGNEGEVGEALKEAFDSGVCSRKDVFVTTKLWCTYHSRVTQALELSLKNLGLDYLDLYLMHWPVPMNPNGNHPNIPRRPDGSRDLDDNWPHTQTWQELEKLPDSGKVKAIGVSNYSVRYLKQLLEVAKTVPAVNQIENHPYLPQKDIVDFCAQKGIHVTAYSPLGSTGSPLFKEDAVAKIAKANGVGEGTVLLSYHVAQGRSVLAKSVTPIRIEENFKIIPLDAADVQALDAVSKNKGLTRYVYPDFGIDFGFPDKTSGPEAIAAN